jgi:four helix bundle protein
MANTPTFNDKIRVKMDLYAHHAYEICKKLPANEKFGLISQLRRASTSVILNFLEGFARRKPKVFLNFLEISFGSLKESQYILLFLKDEGLIQEAVFIDISAEGDEIAAMLWTLIQKIEQACTRSTP